MTTMVLHNLTKCNTIQGGLPKLDRPLTWAAAQLQNGTGHMDLVGDPGTKDEHMLYPIKTKGGQDLDN